MSIINTDISKLAVQDKQVLVKVQINTQMTNTYSTLIATTNGIFNQVWSNKIGLTAQQVFDAFGTDAATLVSMFGVLVTAINQLQPNGISLSAPHTFVINQDGTVTVSA